MILARVPDADMSGEVRKAISAITDETDEDEPFNAENEINNSEDGNCENEAAFEVNINDVDVFSKPDIASLPSFRELTSMLPDGYDYVVTEFNQGRKASEFNCVIRSAIFQKEDALNWLKSFEEKSLTSWNVDQTFKEQTMKIVFKKHYRCQQNTKPKAGVTPREKHTNCPSRIILTIKQYMKRSEDKLIKTHPCQIYIRHCHNHDLSTSLRYRTPTEDVTETFKELFLKNHSPSTALQTYKFDLRVKHGDEYYKKVSDGAVCPTKQWVYKLYYKVFKKKCRDPDDVDMLTSMEKYIEEYNKECGEICAVLKRSEAGFAVALCSPLMRRVHILLENSREVIFIDSSGNMDRRKKRIFIFSIMCTSLIGALPLGIFLTDSESEESIKQGLSLLLTVLPDTSFYGQKFASVIVTNDCSALRNSLRMVFPTSKLYLCIFHVLQNVMQHLWQEKNNVEPADRQILYRAFQKSLYSRDTEEFLESILFLNAVCAKYINIQSYFKTLYTCAEEWALCYREETPGNNTDNYCDTTFRLLKDKIFQRLKSFNILQLFHFIVTRFDNYYCLKITDMINGRTEKNEEYFFSETKLAGLEAELIVNSLYSVKNFHSNQQYTIDAATSHCTCYVGSSGAPCKHQYLVSKKFNIPLQFLINSDILSKLQFHEIAYGNTNLSSDWHNTLTPDESCCSYSGENPDESCCSYSEEDTLVSNEIESRNEILKLNQEVNKIVSSNDSEQSVNVEKITEKIKLFCEDLKGKLEKNPKVYAEPIKKFLDNYKKCKTESSLVSALHTFGKRNPMPVVQKGENLQGGRMIGVQPIAIAPQKISIGGQATVENEHPIKTSYTAEHAKRKRKPEKTYFRPIKKKIS